MTIPITTSLWRFKKTKKEMRNIAKAQGAHGHFDYVYSPRSLIEIVNQGLTSVMEYYLPNKLYLYESEFEDFYEKPLPFLAYCTFTCTQYPKARWELVKLQVENQGDWWVPLHQLEPWPVENK